MKGINFGAALDHLINAQESMTRDGWAHDNGTKKIKLQKPDEFSKMTAPYFFMTITAAGKGDDGSDLVTYIPWSPSNADLLAQDWVIAG